MIKEKINLIPRFNWDYNLNDLKKSVSCLIASPEINAWGLDNIFGEKAIPINSGRTSLYVILKSLRLKKGAEIGVPLYCCPVVFDAIRKAELVPKFIDINPYDYNISAKDLKKKKKKNNLSAVIVVHMFGHPADMDDILSVTGNLPVIEDCAHSLFSKYKEKYTGFLADASFFSFRSGKFLSAGEGGAIFTKHLDLKKYMENEIEKFESQNGFEEFIHSVTVFIKSTLYKRPFYGTIGYPVGTKLDKKLNLTAKDGFELKKIRKTDLFQIESRIKEFQDKMDKQKRNTLYLAHNIKLRNSYFLNEKNDCLSNNYQFPMRFNTEKERDSVSNYLFKCGIDTAKYLDEVIDIAKANYGYTNDCEISEKYSKTVLTIPNHYNLSQRDLSHIVQCFNTYDKF